MLTRCFLHVNPCHKFMVRGTIIILILQMKSSYPWSLNPPTWLVQLNPQLPLKIPPQGCSAPHPPPGDPGLMYSLSQSPHTAVLTSVGERGSWPWDCALRDSPCPLSSHFLSSEMEHLWGAGTSSPLLWDALGSWNSGVPAQIALSHSHGFCGIIPWPIFPRATLLSWWH